MDFFSDGFSGVSLSSVKSSLLVFLFGCSFLGLGVSDKTVWGGGSVVAVFAAVCGVSDKSVPSFSVAFGVSDKGVSLGGGVLSVSFG